jgi:hypothetical protein
MMEELHINSINRGHEASYGAKSRARERAYSNIRLTCFNILTGRGGYHFQNCTANNYEYSTAKILFKFDGVGI